MENSQHHIYLHSYFKKTRMQKWLTKKKKINNRLMWVKNLLNGATLIYIYFIFFLEPGSAPRNVQVRPLSSSTMVIQWDEPETPNGQVTVRE